MITRGSLITNVRHQIEFQAWIQSGRIYLAANHDCPRNKLASRIGFDTIVQGNNVKAIHKLAFVLVNSLHLQSIKYWVWTVLINLILIYVLILTWMSNKEAGLTFTPYSLERYWATFILFSCLTVWTARWKPWSSARDLSLANCSKWVIQSSPMCYKKKKGFNNVHEF